MRSASLSSVFCPPSSRAARWSAPAVAWVALVSLFTLHSSLFTSSAQAEEWGFAYSGQLLETRDGQRTPAKVNGSADFTTNFFVRLYDDSEKTCVKKEALWGRLVTDVPVKDGNFAFEVHDKVGTSLPDTACLSIRDAFAKLSGDRMTIGITPFDDNHDEISPRQQLVTVPYAVFAGDVRGAPDGLAIGGTLTAARLNATSVTFEKDVVHGGDVSFSESPSVPSLSLPQGILFAADAVETEGTLSVQNLSATNLVMREANVELKKAPSFTATGDLKVTDKVSVPAVVARDGESVTLDGSVSAHGLSAAKVVLNGSVNLFDFAQEVAVLPQGASSSSSTMEWKNGSWTVPSRELQGGVGHNYFVSLSLRLASDAEDVHVKVDSVTVAQLSVSGLSNSGGVTNSVWMPFQTILRPGETISWTGGNWSDTNVLFTVRAAGF